MPPRRTLAAPQHTGNPDTAAPSSPRIEATSPGITHSPARHVLSDSDEDLLAGSLPASQLNAEDAPGPSSTYIPRAPTPPLPDLFSGFEEDDDESEPDEVVATLPIYLSAAMFPSVNLFQYPIRRETLRTPTWAADRGKSISARMKEGVGRVEVEVPVDAGETVWRDERARDLGFVTDVNAVNGSGDVEGGYGFYGGRGAEEAKRKGEKSKKKGKEKWGDKARYRSEAVPSATGYYSGLVHDGALYLHPISKVLQLRTSLAYVDEYDATSKRMRGDVNGAEDEAAKAKAKATPLARPPGMGPEREAEMEQNDGSGSLKDFRNKMLWSAQKEEAEPWVPYKWLDESASQAVVDKLDRLIVPEEKRGRLECRTRALDYLNKS